MTNTHGCETARCSTKSAADQEWQTPIPPRIALQTPAFRSKRATSATLRPKLRAVARPVSSLRSRPAVPPLARRLQFSSSSRYIPAITKIGPRTWFITRCRLLERLSDGCVRRAGIAEHQILKSVNATLRCDRRELCNCLASVPSPNDL